MTIRSGCGVVGIDRNFKDVVRQIARRRSLASAQWFEDHSPIDPRFKKKEVKGCQREGYHRGAARRRLLPVHPHRDQSSQRGLDPEILRVEVGHAREHHVCLRSGGTGERIPGGVLQFSRGNRPDQEVRIHRRQSSHRSPRVCGPRLRAAPARRELGCAEELRRAARRSPGGSLRPLLSHGPETRRTGSSPVHRRREGGVCAADDERTLHAAGPDPAGKVHRRSTPAEQAADRPLVLREGKIVERHRTLHEGRQDVFSHQ